MSYQQLDPRLMSITLGIGERNFLFTSYPTNNRTRESVLSNTGFAMWANGTKYVNANQGEATVSIAGLKKETRDFIVQSASPFNGNLTAKRITVSAGRQSYGESLIYTGDVTKGEVGQAPDLILNLKCLTLNFQNGNIITASNSGLTKLSVLSQQIATSIGVALQFEATDQDVSNYSFSGAALKQIERLNSIGNVNAYIDNDILIVKNKGIGLRMSSRRVMSQATGMIGTPEVTEYGIRVRFFLDNSTRTGSEFDLISSRNPSLNGPYVIYKLAFDISSRDDPFYWIADAQRLPT